MMNRMQSPPTTSARCYCSAVRIQFNAAPKSVIHCHCGQCRRLSGSAFTTWVSFSRQAMELVGEASLSEFRATSNVLRRFCSHCGSHIYTTDSRATEIVGVPSGVIVGELPPPKAHYFVHHKAAWHAIGDALRQFGGETGFEPIPSAGP
jgi:hypothetical protein